MPDVIVSRFAETELAEKVAWKRYAEAKGDNWRDALSEWVQARDASYAAWVDAVSTRFR